MTNFQYTETKYMLTVQEASRVLGVSVHTVYRLINSGELSTVKISQRRTVIKAEELEKHINRKWGGFHYEGNNYKKIKFWPVKKLWRFWKSVEVHSINCFRQGNWKDLKKVTYTKFLLNWLKSMLIRKWKFELWRFRKLCNELSIFLLIIVHIIVIKCIWIKFSFLRTGDALPYKLYF